MSFIDALPLTYTDLLKKREETRLEAAQIETNLDDDSMVVEHNCDCDYCPVADRVPLDSDDREVLEERQNELEDILIDYDKVIGSVEGYAKLVKVKLPEVKK